MVKDHMYQDLVKGNRRVMKITASSPVNIRIKIKCVISRVESDLDA